MSRTHKVEFDMCQELKTQLNSKTFHKFEASSKEQFDELMKVMNHMEEQKNREDKLKEELRNIKGPKKNIAWKKEQTLKHTLIAG